MTTHAPSTTTTANPPAADKPPRAWGRAAQGERRAPGFWPLATVFALFVLFLYGPMLTIFVLSFQGPEGGLTFPMRGWSLHWYHQLAKGLGVVDIGAAFRRSLALGGGVMLLTVVLSVLAGLAFGKRLRGGDALVTVTVASLIMPSIIVSLGIGLEFRLIDNGIKAVLEWLGMESALECYGTSLGLSHKNVGNRNMFDRSPFRKIWIINFHIWIRNRTVGNMFIRSLIIYN